MKRGEVLAEPQPRPSIWTPAGPLSDVLSERLKLALLCKNEPSMREIVMQRCRVDVEFWVANFVWTFDPRTEPSVLPLIPWQKQREFFTYVQSLMTDTQDGVVEKSRDAGATWLLCCFIAHQWLFKKGFTAGIGSRKLMLVDDLGNPQCIFDKLRTIIDNLPSWMQPVGYDRRKHDNFCRIINPANGSTITGEGGDDIGRGGRTTLYVVDEAAFIARPERVDRALSNNAKVRIWLSTPNGSANTFARKRFNKAYRVFTFHWKDDPRKNAWNLVDEDGEVMLSGTGSDQIPEYADGLKVEYPWYEKQKRLFDPITIAQEMDISYTASLEGVIIPSKWLRAAVGLKLPESAHVVAGLDVAAGGGAKNAYIERAGPVLRVIESWYEGFPAESAYKAFRLLEEAKGRRMFYDSIGVGADVGGIYKTAGRKFPFDIVPVNVGAVPTNAIWADGQRSSEKFVNLKCELWARVRERAKKTYEYVEEGVSYPLDELMSFPDCPETDELIAQLSNVRWFDSTAGKMIVESKLQLATRGVKSPDLAEAYVLSFAPVKRGVKRSSGAAAGGVSHAQKGSRASARSGGRALGTKL